MVVIMAISEGPVDNLGKGTSRPIDLCEPETDRDRTLPLA